MITLLSYKSDLSTKKVRSYLFTTNNYTLCDFYSNNNLIVSNFIFEQIVNYPGFNPSLKLFMRLCEEFAIDWFLNVTQGQMLPVILMYIILFVHLLSYLFSRTISLLMPLIAKLSIQLISSITNYVHFIAYRDQYYYHNYHLLILIR